MTDDGRRNAWVRWLAIAALAAAGYFLAAKLGYTFRIRRSIVPLWPPSGLMLALLLLSPRRDWVAIVGGGMMGNFLSDMGGGMYGFASAASAANALESVTVATFICWFSRGPVTLCSLRSVLALAAGATVVNGVTALAGASVLSGFFSASFFSAWFAWWVGDGLGMLIVAPLLLTATIPRERVIPRARMIEGICLVVTILVVGSIALGPSRGWPMQPGPYLTFPLLFWAALRFGPRGAAGSAALLAAIATWYVGLGVGRFAAQGASGMDTAMQLYVYMALASLSSLIPAAALEQQMESARELSNSEARYRSVMDAATDAIITIDESDCIGFANPAVERIFGYRPEELLGEDLTVLMPVHSRGRHKAGFRRYLETGQKSIPWKGVPLTGLHKDGHEVPLEVSFGEVLEHGQRQFTGVLRDVSEKHLAQRTLHETEERMRFALDAAGVGIWEVDFASGAAKWSEKLEVLHGLRPGTFGGTFDAFVALIHPDDRKEVLQAVDTATRDHVNSNLLYRSVWPDGSVHWISGIGRTTYDAQGVPVRSAGIGFDVTERRALEEQFRQSQKMEAVGQLAGGVAHDFNNVLTVINGASTLLRESMHRDDPLQEDVSEILRAGARAQALTSQLLAFSRRQLLAPRVIRLEESLHTMEPMLKRLLGEHIKIVIRAENGLAAVKADPGQIEQVIMNLAINARDAMPEGGTLLFELANVDAAGRPGNEATGEPQVALAVSDTGTGMDPATAARVFEPFFTTKPQGKGTGLGLATVHGIVRQSGGSVSVYTELGRGTTFRVLLPQSKAAPESSTPTPLPVGRDSSETVLVVEDDDGLRRLVVRMLQKQGFRVMPAATPEEALTTSRSFTGAIDLLVTDVVLPGMNGRALVETLAPERPDMKVLFMSGYTDDTKVVQGIREQQMHFLQKPFNATDLARKIAEILDRRRA